MFCVIQKGTITATKVGSRNYFAILSDFTLLRLEKNRHHIRVPDIKLHRFDSKFDRILYTNFTKNP